MRILLTGRRGQLGAELERSLGPLGKLFAFDRDALDLADSSAIPEKISQVKPTTIVNAAAYTAVDRAESERASAFAVNAAAVGILAEEARKLDALLVHFSTDYVFDGEKTAPYTEDDAPRPLSVYGESKLAGERAVAGSGCRHLIFRTGWVYAARGRNFLGAMLAGAKEKRELRVVDDQRGAPTSAAAIAQAVARVLSSGDPQSARGGLYHLSAAGETTWYGFARAILEGKRLTTPLHAIRTEEYPTAARRPKMCLLDNAKFARDFGFSLPDWRGQLAAVLAAIH